MWHCGNDHINMEICQWIHLQVMQISYNEYLIQNLIFLQLHQTLMGSISMSCCRKTMTVLTALSSCMGQTQWHTQPPLSPSCWRTSANQLSSQAPRWESRQTCDAHRWEPRQTCDAHRWEPGRTCDAHRWELWQTCDAHRWEPRQTCDPHSVSWKVN